MIDRPILTALPNCDLIAVLTEKASQRNDVKFDFIGRLNDFRERVSGEVRQINLLFPEYTPHDDEYHLSRLFHVASLVLGRDRLEAMNSAELFILAISLYGHDWGMAVSELEKEYILSKNKLSNSTDFWILPNEKSKFAQFLKNQGFSADYDKSKISVELWREYIRQTHAFRSAERVRKYFEHIDGGISDAASRVCEGHWLDFEELDKYNRYPVDFSVLQETVNLRALAVYLRLIDLLDLAEDRTPYIIWKFVAPRDPRSKMEWNKHRALRPITCPPYQQGRIIKVDGSTEDHEVFAALEDLRIWCEEQLRGCNDILARMNDSRHKLDIYHIDWRVNPRGFKPILIQFEFDRERMFEILGSDIYQNDSYVFLRELLQNSIDAIRVRREILNRNGVTPGQIGTIRVNVEHGQNGDAVVVWEDDGVGMDDYVIRNYFSIAGKSYYRSADFEREGLNIDPISRFGIGFLSCFMVADLVEINTFKDPYLPPPSEPLSIRIPAMKGQFRIEELPRESTEVGTKIRIYVNGKKLPIDNKNKGPKPLEVTGYLCKIAGFVDFPIVITEDQKKTIIIHPHGSTDNVLRRFGHEFKIHQLDLTFPWSEAILAQDQTSAKELLKEIHLDFRNDLHMSDYEGSISYLIPQKSTIDFKFSYLSGFRGVKEAVFGREKEQIIRPESKWDIPYKGESITFIVYKDGILVPKSSAPRFNYQRRGYPNPKIIANIRKQEFSDIDLARTMVIDTKDNHWSYPIKKVFVQFLLEKLNPLSLDPLTRAYEFGRLISFHIIDRQDLWEAFPHSHWPILVLDKFGQLTALEWKELEGKVIRLSPLGFDSELAELANKKWLSKKKVKGSLFDHWNGEPCIIAPASLDKASMAVSETLHLFEIALLKNYCLSEIQFAKPPSKEGAPLAMQILAPNEGLADKNSFEEILSKAIEDPLVLGPKELSWVMTQTIEANIEEEEEEEELYIFGYEGDTWIATTFSQPFQNYLGYGWGVLNLNHSIVQWLIRCIAVEKLWKIQKNFSREKAGLLTDALQKLRPSTYFGIYNMTISVYSYEELCSNLHKLWIVAKDIGIPRIEDTNLIPRIDEFVPGTFGLKFLNTRKNDLITPPPIKYDKKNIKAFGYGL